MRTVKRTGLGGGPARRVNPADGAAALDELEEEVLYKPLLRAIKARLRLY